MNDGVRELLGSQYLVIQGGLAHIATRDFASVVSNGSAFGQITATSLPESKDLVAAVDAPCQRTSWPFGTSLAIGHRPLYPFLEVALRMKSRTVSSTGGNSEPYLPRIKEWPGSWPWCW